MPVVSHSIEYGAVSGTRQRVQYTFTMHTAETFTAAWKTIEQGADADADAVSMYPQIVRYFEEAEYDAALEKIEQRQDPDATPQHLTQVDFDRRVLGYLMTVQDPHKLNASLPFWLAVQPRNGANASQRAANLGVPLGEYLDVADRFNQYAGVSSFLSGDLLAIWSDIPGDWE